jgi:uncharacterized protein YkwD
MHIHNGELALLLALTTFRCTSVGFPTPPPTLLPYPDALDVMLVHEEVTAAVNEARAERGIAPLKWDEELQELAEWQAWQVTKGAIVFDEIDDWPATQLREPVIELRACMSDNVTTPDAMAQYAIEHWLDDTDLRGMLLSSGQRIGVGHDWGCLTERGVVLVVLLAGGTPLGEG